MGGLVNLSVTTLYGIRSVGWIFQGEREQLELVFKFLHVRVVLFLLVKDQVAFTVHGFEVRLDTRGLVRLLFLVPLNVKRDVLFLANLTDERPEYLLEEGAKATAWKDPDVVESVERTGIDLTNGTVSVEAANFEIKHNGEKPFVVSKGKALLGGWVFDKGQLFSQCGDVNGNPSTDYGNVNFNPDIVLDPINGYMSGVGSFRKKMLVITPQNIAKYAIINSDGDYEFMAGKISAIALFKGSFNRTIYITLPGVAGSADFEIARTLIGETIAIYNQTTSYMIIWGSGQSTVLYPNKFAALEVKISVNPQTGKESYYNVDWINGEMLV